MTHYHDNHCFHDLRYCSVCDKCYCTKCSKEWGKNWYSTNTSYPIGGNLSSSMFNSATSGITGTTSKVSDDLLATKVLNEIAHIHQEQKK